MLGAAIGRSGVLDDIPSHLPVLRKIRNLTLAFGLALAFVVVALAEWPEQLLGGTGETAAELLKSPSALLLAAGYACMVATGWHTPTGRKLLAPLRPVGQMALTNYLMQGLAYAFVLFGVGPGLALGGKLGTLAVVGIVIAFFAFQSVFSHWWLARFRFGPMEWLWRWLTYGGSMPVIRRRATG